MKDDDVETALKALQTANVAINRLALRISPTPPPAPGGAMEALEQLREITAFVALSIQDRKDRKDFVPFDHDKAIEMVDTIRAALAQGQEAAEVAESYKSRILELTRPRVDVEALVEKYAGDLAFGTRETLSDGLRAFAAELLGERGGA